MKRPFLIVLPLVAVTMLLIAANHVYTEQQPLGTLQPPLQPPRAAFGNSIAATGIVEAASQNILVGSALPGVVLEVHVPAERVGVHVARGTPLFRVDDRHLRAQLALATARAAAAQSQLDKLLAQPRAEDIPPSEAKVAAARANAERARDEFERAVSAGRAAGRIRPGIGDQAPVARTGRARLEAQPERARFAARRRLETGSGNCPRRRCSRRPPRLSRFAPRSNAPWSARPIDGEVLQVNIREGEFVSDRTQQGLVVLGRIDQLHVRADIDENDIPYFHRSARAVAHIRGRADRGYAMQFVRIEPYVVAKRWLTGDNTERIDTRVLQVVFSVETTDAPLFVGQQVDVGHPKRNATRPQSADRNHLHRDRREVSRSGSRVASLPSIAPASGLSS